MKKKLLCLLLCLCTVLTMFVSCSDTTDEDAEESISEEASESAVTLTMHLVSEKAVTEKAKTAVEEAVNALTKSKYKVQLKLYFYTTDEYYKLITEKMDNYIESRANKGLSLVEEEETLEAGAEEETEQNEYGLNIIKYPDELDYQVDIIYIGDLDNITGEQMYNNLVSGGYLQELDTELSSSSKKIKEYVSPTLLSAVKSSSHTYAIPNNNIIGSYTYLQLNKSLVDAYAMNGYVESGAFDKFDSDALFNYIDTLASLEFTDGEPFIGATYEQCLSLLAYYWNIDAETLESIDEFSVIGSYYEDMSTLSRGTATVAPESLLANDDFRKAFEKLNTYRLNGYFAESEEAIADIENPAFTFVTGDTSVPEASQDTYYSIIVEYPTATSSDIYGNMFGVFSGSRSLSKSMEIVTYLNTDEEFRNLIQYGIEQGDRDDAYYNYKIVDGRVVRNNEDYVLNIESTGNVFLTKLTGDMDEDIWVNGKAQNRDSKISPLLGFDVADYAVEASTTTETVSVSKAGYNMSVTYGYSKEQFSTNATITKWLNSCTGEGIFVLPTSTLDGQVRTSYYYILNTKGDYQVKAEGVDITSYTIGKNSTVSAAKYGADLYVEFTGKSANTLGYTLAVVEFVTKKSFTYEFYYVDGTLTLTDAELPSDATAVQAIIDEEGSCVRKTQEVEATLLTPTIAKGTVDAIDFDFLSTDLYEIDAHTGISITSFIENKELYYWQIDAIASKKDCTYIYKKSGETEDVYTVAVYKYNKKTDYTYEVEIIPTVQGETLTMTLNFSDTGSKPATSDEASCLCFFTITLPKDMNLELAGNEVASESGNVKAITYTETEGTTDPEFRMVGNLNYESIKFIQDLNEKVNELLASIKTAEKFTAVCEDLAILLKGYEKITDIPYLDETCSTVNYCFNTSEVREFAKKFFTKATDAVTFNYHMKVATSSTAVSPTSYDGEKEVVTTYGDNSIAIALYSSIGELYQKWLTAYGFVPAT